MTIELDAEQVTYICKAIHTLQHRCEQRIRHARKELTKIRPELQASRVRDSLLLSGGLGMESLPGTTGELRKAVRHRENTINSLQNKILYGGGAAEYLGTLGITK